MSRKLPCTANCGKIPPKFSPGISFDIYYKLGSVTSSPRWQAPMIDNQYVYHRSKVAAQYSQQSYLEPSEEIILHLLLPDLPNARMLDLGVGGGRTTLHFAKWAKEYVGADYSPSMIAQCQRRFSGYPAHLSFRVCDARSMGMFETGSFDFTLFSFNGIDSVSHED